MPLLNVACIRLVCLLSSEDGQFKNLKEAVYVRKSNVTKPLTLQLDGRQDVLLLVWSVVVGVCNIPSACLGIRPAVELMQVIDEELVKQVLAGFSRGSDVFKIQEDTAGVQEIEYLRIENVFPLIRLVVDGEARHNDVEGAMGLHRFDPLWS